MVADFNSVYSTPTPPPSIPHYKPNMKPAFIGSYPPITPPGQMGSFMVNTYFLRDDRKAELFGSTALRAFQVCGK